MKQKHVLDVQIRRGIRNNKPVLIWIKQVCLPCQRKMPDYIHAHVTSCTFDNGKTIDDCCVIVTKPEGGSVTVEGTIPGCPDDIAQRVRDLLNPRPVQFMPPPPPMLFGGFGSGCSS